MSLAKQVQDLEDKKEHLENVVAIAIEKVGTFIKDYDSNHPELTMPLDRTFHTVELKRLMLILHM